MQLQQTQSTYTPQAEALQLQIHDAYALRRVLARMPWDDLPMSPMLRLVLNGLDFKSDSPYQFLERIIRANPATMHQIMMMDCYNPLPSPEHVIDADELKRLTTPQYIMTEYPFYEGAFNALVGPSGSGKSFVALDFAARMALGLQSGAVVYIAAEGLHGYSSRWEAWKKFNHVDSGFGRFQFYSEAVNLLKMENTAKFMDEIEQYEPRFIIVDTVARCMVGGDENSARDIGMFIANIDFIRRQLTAGVLVVHHTGKDGTMRGSTALYGACDSVLFLRREDDTIGLHNEHSRGGKNKFQAEHPSRYAALLPVDVTIQGETVNSAVLIPTERIQVEAPDEEKPVLKPRQLEILQEIAAWDGGADKKLLVESTGIARATVYRNVNQLEKMGYIIQDDFEKYLITEAGKAAL